MQAKAIGVNPLGTEKIGKLLIKYSVPATIGILVSALYNIVDQIFIGQGIGLLGNAATNVAFPIVTMCTAIALLLGVGGAVNFNLSLGANNTTRAKNVLGTSIFLLATSGIVFAIIVALFLNPLLNVFGATIQIFDLAHTYTIITTIGIPFLIFSSGASPLIRADGSPMYSMIAVLLGAVVNMILDPILIFGLDMGIAGAAIATVIGQVISTIAVLYYMRKFKSVSLQKKDFKVHFDVIKSILALGAGACFFNLTLTAFQITMNNVLRHYGSQSIYGAEIPLAVVGVISKVNVILVAFTLGISQGAQPIFGFNYGAKQYDRVKALFKIASITILSISLIAEILFQVFPRQIVSIFGSGSELYYEFAINYFRIFMLFTITNGMMPLAGNFFSSIGKAASGIFISLVRQVIVLIPLIIILPIYMGINGVMYAGPIADFLTIFVVASLVIREFKHMNMLEKTVKEKSELEFKFQEKAA